MIKFLLCRRADLRLCHCAGAADEGKGVIVTPLMQFLAEKHALKAAPAAKAAGKASAGRGAGGQRKGAARLRSTSLAPVAEAEEGNPVTAAAPAAAADAPAGRRKVRFLAARFVMSPSFSVLQSRPVASNRVLHVTGGQQAGPASCCQSRRHARSQQKC